MRGKIIPTVFSKDRKSLESRIEILKPVARELQVDFMDGRFVKNKSVELKDISLDKKHSYEAHLMTLKPYLYLKELKRKGFRKAIFHYEACDAEEIENTIKISRKLKLKVFIAINPGTSITPIIPFLNEVDGVLLMGVNPGKENQELISSIYNKIKELRKLSKKIVIQIDGGTNLKNAKKLRKSGADILNTGSFVAGSKDPKKAFVSLKKAFLARNI